MLRRSKLIKKQVKEIILGSKLIRSTDESYHTGSEQSKKNINTGDSTNSIDRLERMQDRLAKLNTSVEEIKQQLSVLVSVNYIIINRELIGISIFIFRNHHRTVIQ